MPSPFLSIIICTRNRADELVNCLPELASQAKHFSDVEVVIIDNGSTDNTQAVVNQASEEYGFIFRYETEPTAGLSRARNRGCAVALGQVLAYVDDDVRIGPEWIKRVREHFLQRKSDCLAGKVEVTVEGPLPSWFPNDLLWVLGKTMLGDEERDISFPLHPQGNNFAVTKSVFETVHGFDIQITLYGDETEFFRRVSQHNFTMRYDPNIVVTQHIPAHRLSQKALKHKAYIWGRGSSLIWLLGSPSSFSRWSKAGEYLLRAVYVGGRWCVSPQFGRYFTFWHNCGKLRQLIAGVR